MYQAKNTRLDTRAATTRANEANLQLVCSNVDDAGPSKGHKRSRAPPRVPEVKHEPPPVQESVREKFKIDMACAMLEKDVRDSMVLYQQMTRSAIDQIQDGGNDNVVSSNTVNDLVRDILRKCKIN